MSLKPNDRTLLARIQREEDFRHVPYKDSLDIWTVGWGSNMHYLPAEELAAVWSMPNRTDGPGITEDQGRVFMLADVRFTLDYLQSLSWWPSCTRAQQLAFADMAYQLGPPRFRQFKRMLAACRRGAWDKAADEALDSLYAKQAPNRAARVAAAIRQAS